MIRYYRRKYQTPGNPYHYYYFKTMGHAHLNTYFYVGLPLSLFYGVICISDSYFWHIFLQCFFSVCKDVDKSEEHAMFDILCVLEMVGAVKANKQFSIHLFALYGHHGLNVNVSNTPLFAWSMVQTRQYWPVVNVKIGCHWQEVVVVRPQCKRIHVYFLHHSPITSC